VFLSADDRRTFILRGVQITVKFSCDYYARKARLYHRLPLKSINKKSLTEMIYGDEILLPDEAFDVLVTNLADNCR